MSVADDYPVPVDGEFANVDPRILLRFTNFHTANPLVFSLFLQYALELIDAGRSQYGSRSLIERVRWEVNLLTNSDAFKINNDFSPLYARLAMHHFPDVFDDFFRCRRLTRHRRLSSVERRLRLANGEHLNG